MTTSNSKLIPVILSGGSGTRLWPLSRSEFPKQFCDLFGDSLFRQTYRRLSKVGSPWVVSAQILKNLTEGQLRKESRGGSAALHLDQLLYEPAARNTAPAVGFILRALELRNQLDQIVGIFPADHLIQDEESFQTSIEVAVAQAQKGSVVTLGIKPNEPHTGYGYIQVESGKLNQAEKVLGFHEKPTLEKAQAYLSSGNFLWNSGVFIFKASVMWEALQKYQPEIWKGLQELEAGWGKLSEIYPRLPSQSLDYGIMEKLPAAAISCVPVDFGWSDVGSWDAISELMDPAQAPEMVQLKGSGNFVHSSLSKKSYSLIGLSDLIVVDTEDATLILKKGQSQDVKLVVDQWLTRKPELTKSHVYEQRPWGNFRILRDEPHFKSKIIQIEPGQQISLQSHARREEHWVVTQGVGEVVLNGKTLAVRVGSHIHVPIGAQHRMRNSSKDVLEFVEVQLGSYFGEDDIVRYQDDYHRV